MPSKREKGYHLVSIVAPAFLLLLHWHQAAALYPSNPLPTINIDVHELRASLGLFCQAAAAFEGLQSLKLLMPGHLTSPIFPPLMLTSLVKLQASTARFPAAFKDLKVLPYSPQLTPPPHANTDIGKPSMDPYFHCQACCDF